MPNHIISCFKCPAKITKAIDKKARDFFWGSNSKVAAVAWDKVFTPKNVGGLGIRPSGHFNNAALAKLGWKIITHNENWSVKIVKAKYLRHSSFFSRLKRKPSLFLFSLERHFGNKGADSEGY